MGQNGQSVKPDGSDPSINLVINKMGTQHFSIDLNVSLDLILLFHSCYFENDFVLREC